METAAKHGALGDFQNDFAEALLAPRGAPAPLSMTALTAQPGFAVYRNTVMKACIDALQANFPAVTRLVGDEWFRAAAAVYVNHTPPEHPALLHYGAAFPAFLAAFEPARGMPYLAGVAQLDRLWTEAHTARDQSPLNPGVLAGRSTESLATTVLRPHAAARWAWFAGGPVYSIWARNRTSEPAEDAIWQPDWQAQGALLTRPFGAVAWMELDAAGVAFLESCARSETLAQAAAAALETDDQADLRQLMARLLSAGAIADHLHTASDG